MMVEQHLHLTKSHLLRRLLQRRVETLEEEKIELRSHISELEQRLTHSTARHAALTGGGGFQNDIANTMVHVRALGERAQSEAEFTLRITRPKQETLLEGVTRLHKDSEQLCQMMGNVLEGVQAIEAQIQTSSVVLVKNANQQQEQFTSELDALYDDESELRYPMHEAQERIKDVQERARLERARLDVEAMRERERLLDQIEALQHEGQNLHTALQRALESVSTFNHWTHVEAAESLDDEQVEKIKRSLTDRGYPLNEDVILEAARAAIAQARYFQDNDMVEEVTEEVTEDAPEENEAFPYTATSTLVVEEDNSLPTVSTTTELPEVINGPEIVPPFTSDGATFATPSHTLVVLQRVLMGVLLGLIMLFVFSFAL